jgi:hypothetical protein
MFTEIKNKALAKLHEPSKQDKSSCYNCTIDYEIDSPKASNKNSLTKLFEKGVDSFKRRSSVADSKTDGSPIISGVFKFPDSLFKLPSISDDKMSCAKTNVSSTEPDHQSNEDNSLKLSKKGSFFTLINVQGISDKNVPSFTSKKKNMA